jgi:hypothetical protein
MLASTQNNPSVLFDRKGDHEDDYFHSWAILDPNDSIETGYRLHSLGINTTLNFMSRGIRARTERASMFQSPIPAFCISFPHPIGAGVVRGTGSAERISTPAHADLHISMGQA